MQIVPDFSAVAPDIKRGKPKEMLTLTKVGEQTRVRINSSSLSIILSCPRKSYYTLMRGLKSKTESPALVFGSAIHKALEVFYGSPREVRGIPANFKEHSDLMAFGSPAPEKHFLYDCIEAFVKVAQPLVGLPGSDKRSIPNGIWTLQEYFKTYINDPYVVYCDENGPVTERFAEAVLYEDPTLKITVFGTIDVVLRNEANGIILPADHKTSSQLGNDFYNRIKPNSQYTGYLWLAQQVLGLKTNEFMVNAIQVKPKPVTARGSTPNFARQITTRSEHDIVEFGQSVLWAVRSYLFWRDAESWPIGTVDSCAQWGGCQYLDVCSAPSEIRENILSAKFVGVDDAITQ